MNSALRILVLVAGTIALAGCPGFLDGNPPTVTVTAPIADQVVDGATLTVEGTASDGDGDLVSVTALILEDTTITVTVTAAQIQDDGGYTMELDLAGLANGTYTLEVAARDAGDAVSDPVEVSFTLQIAEELSPPETPSDLIVGNPTSFSLDVSWTTSEGATSYQIYRDVGDGEDFVDLVYDSDGTSFTDSDLEPDTQYRYKIQATNEAGSSALSVAHQESTNSAPVNLLTNGSADDGTTGWSPTGPAGAATMIATSRTVFYLDSDVADPGYLSQTITLPAGSGGQYLVLLAYGWIETSATMVPYLYGYEREADNTFIGYVQDSTSSPTGGAEHWSTMYIVWWMDSATGVIDLFLNQANTGDGPEGSRATVDDVEVLVVGTYAEAEHYRAAYAADHPTIYESAN